MSGPGHRWDTPWPLPTKITVPVAQPDLSQLERRLVADALSESWIGPASPWVSEFEELLSAHLGVPALSVSNGSVALILALRALEVGHGHEVIVPSLTYAATASSVVNVGARPVFCDVDPRSWTIDVEAVERSITASTRAIIAVHTYGIRANVDKLHELAQRYNLALIEDAAEAFPAEAADSESRTLSDVQTYSFFANKLVTTGEGGAVSTDDVGLFERLRLLRGQGMDPTRRYYFLEAGYNFRMASLPAALGVGQLKRYASMSAARARCEEAYASLLSDILIRPESVESSARIPWLYTAAFQGKSSLNVARELADHGVETRPVFFPLNEMPAFAPYASTRTNQAASLAQRGITLPTGAHVSEGVVQRVVEIIRKAMED